MPTQPRNSSTRRKEEEDALKRRKKGGGRGGRGRPFLPFPLFPPSCSYLIHFCYGLTALLLLPYCTVLYCTIPSHHSSNKRGRHSLHRQKGRKVRPTLLVHCRNATLTFTHVGTERTTCIVRTYCIRTVHMRVYAEYSIRPFHVLLKY